MPYCFDEFDFLRAQLKKERKQDKLMIELKDVRKSYNGKVIFEDVDLKLEEGTVTAFVDCERSNYR